MDCLAEVLVTFLTEALESSEAPLEAGVQWLETEDAKLFCPGAGPRWGLLDADALQSRTCGRLSLALLVLAFLCQAFSGRPQEALPWWSSTSGQTRRRILR